MLGPNGAGKTTTIRMLATLLRPDSGTARVLGHDIVTEADAVRGVVSLTGQLASVDEDLTGRENLILIGRLLGLSRAEREGQGGRSPRRVRPGRSVGAPCQELLGRHAQRLDLAASIVVTPELMFLDEPTTASTRARETRSGASSERWRAKERRSSCARSTSTRQTSLPRALR